MNGDIAGALKIAFLAAGWVHSAFRCICIWLKINPLKNLIWVLQKTKAAQNGGIFAPNQV
jgi:hypothetical protein